MASLKLSKVRWICQGEPGIYVTWDGRQTFEIFKNGQRVYTHTRHVNHVNPGHVDVAAAVANELLDEYLDKRLVVG